MPVQSLKLSKSCFIKSNWRMVNQIQCIQITIMILLGGVSIFITFMAQYILEAVVHQAANEIFLKSIKSNLNTIWLYQYTLEEVLHMGKQQIYLVNNLHILMQEMLINQNNFTSQSPIACLNTANTNDSYCYSSSNCYGLFGDTFTQNDKQQLQPILNVVSLLTTFRITIDNTQALYFSHKNNAQLYSISQGFYFPVGFKPHSRPWYKNHIIQTENSTDITEIIYGAPYIIFLGGIRIASTCYLLNLNYTQSGVIAKDIDFNSSEVFKTIDNYNELNIIKKDGTVIYSKLYDSWNSSAYNISNQSLSGFDEEDFQQILNFHYNKTYKSNCDQISFLLCRYNVLQNQNKVIQTANVTNSPYILLLFRDSTSILKEEQDLILMVNQQFTSSTNEWLAILLICYGVIGLLSYGSIRLILNQLNLLILFTKQSYNKQLDYHYNKNYYLKTKSITQLFQSIYNITHEKYSSTKSQECQNEENKLYPQFPKQNLQYQAMFFHKIDKIIKKLRNSSSQISLDSFKTILTQNNIDY